MPKLHPPREEKGSGVTRAAFITMMWKFIIHTGKFVIPWTCDTKTLSHCVSWVRSGKRDWSKKTGQNWPSVIVDVNYNTTLYSNLASARLVVMEHLPPTPQQLLFQLLALLRVIPRSAQASSERCLDALQRDFISVVLIRTLP